MNVSYIMIYLMIWVLLKGELKKDLLFCLCYENKKWKVNGEFKKDFIL